jgi:hypothetical protein
MSEHRWEARARLEAGMREGRVDGIAPRLVTVCLCDGSGEVSDELGEPVKRWPVLCHLCPSEARALALELLELAELAGRGSEAWK